MPHGTCESLSWLIDKSHATKAKTGDQGRFSDCLMSETREPSVRLSRNPVCLTANYLNRPFCSALATRTHGRCGVEMAVSSPAIRTQPSNGPPARELEIPHLSQNMWDSDLNKGKLQSKHTFFSNKRSGWTGYVAQGV